MNSDILINQIFRGMEYGFFVDWKSHACDKLIKEFNWEGIVIDDDCDKGLKQVLEEFQAPTTVNFLSVGDVDISFLLEYLESPRIIYGYVQTIQSISISKPVELKDYLHYRDGLYIHNQLWHLTL